MPGKGSGKQVNRRVSVIGSNNTVNTVTAVQKKSYLHVYRINPNTTVSDLDDYLKQTAPNFGFRCEILRQSGESVSFKVSFPMEYVDKVYNPEIWPSGAAVRRFFFPRHRRHEAENSQSQASLPTPPDVRKNFHGQASQSINLA